MADAVYICSMAFHHGFLTECISRPSLADVQGAYGFSPNISSWGGSPIYADGEYHLYVAEIADGCGLSAWQTNSQCVHATSKTLAGPYQRRDVAVNIWCHGPSVVVDTTSDEPLYVLCASQLTALSLTGPNAELCVCSFSFSPGILTGAAQSSLSIACTFS